MVLGIIYVIIYELASTQCGGIVVGDNVNCLRPEDCFAADETRRKLKEGSGWADKLASCDIDSRSATFV